jgi:hypothetical protein
MDKKYNIEFVAFPDRLDESEGDFQERMLQMEVHCTSEELIPSGLIDDTLDVFKGEPFPKDYQFFDLENVTLTLHLAGHFLDSMTAPFEILGEEIERFLKGGKLQFVRN